MNNEFGRTSVYVPDSTPIEHALARSTHLAIAAHPDDLELIGIHGIVAAYNQSDQWFSGVVVTNGSGSPRAGNYLSLTDSELIETRNQEQLEAARLGQFSCVVQLGHASADIVDGYFDILIQQLTDYFEKCLPEVVYLHNPLDRHVTHVAVCSHALQALRRMDRELLPKQIYGVEVWRNLDWVSSKSRVSLDLSDMDDLQSRLLGVYKSQIDSGKRYDLAVRGRNIANATFGSERDRDKTRQTAFALDLMPLVYQTELSISEYVAPIIQDLKSDIETKLERFG